MLEALWPDKPPSSTEVLSHAAASELRRALEPWLPPKFPSRYLDVTEGQVTLRLPNGSWLDYGAFENHVHRCEWLEAVALFAGQLFPADRYAGWAAEPRERLNQDFVRAALAAGEQRLREGAPAEAAELCRRTLEIDPWQEKATLLGMRSRAAQGDRTGAMRLYRALEQRLRKDLDTEPEPPLRDLYQALR